MWVRWASGRGRGRREGRGEAEAAGELHSDGRSGPGAGARAAAAVPVLRASLGRAVALPLLRRPPRPLAVHRRRKVAVFLCWLVADFVICSVSFVRIGLDAGLGSAQCSWSLCC